MGEIGCKAHSVDVRSPVAAKPLGVTRTGVGGTRRICKIRPQNRASREVRGEVGVRRRPTAREVLKEDMDPGKKKSQGRVKPIQRREGLEGPLISVRRNFRWKSKKTGRMNGGKIKMATGWWGGGGRGPVSMWRFRKRARNTDPKSRKAVREERSG